MHPVSLTMALGRPLRCMLILISVTTVYLVIMLDRWSEKTRMCQLNQSGCTVIHTTNGVRACKCQANNSTEHILPPDGSVAKQEAGHLQQRRHINYLGGSALQESFNFYRHTSISRSGHSETERLETRLYELQKLLERLEGGAGIDHLGVNAEEIKAAQETVRDIMELVNGSAAGPHPSSSNKDYRSRSVSTSESDNKSGPLAACPEVYRGPLHGYPFYNKGFETVPCTNAKPLHEVTSAVFNFVNYPIKYRSSIRAIVESFAAEHPGVAVLVAVSDRMFSDEVQSLPAQVDIVGHSIREAVIWNRLIARVKTPYTFIGRNLLAYDQDSRLERLVRAMGTLNAAIVAGAIRTPDGYWSLGCHQMAFRNYSVIYRAGYHQSAHECVSCSHVSGPFMAATRLLQNQRFDTNLDARMLFEDYLFNLSLNRSQMVVCPDSMFHVQTDDREKYPKSAWLPLARKWRINQLRFGRAAMVGFTCEELYIDCSFITGLVVPPCCLQLLAEQIKFIMSTCERHGIFCELQEGTLLGAVKLNKVLPWERDGDITFLSSNYTALRNLSGVFAVAGYRLQPGDPTRCCEEGRTAGGTFNIKGIGTPWNVELYGQHRMDSEAEVATGNKPTKVLFHGAWVNVPRNPGLHVRNRYGYEVYRHAQHWISLGKYSGWEMYNPDGFTKCPVPGKHSCLDQYRADGNLQFELPVP